MKNLILICLMIFGMNVQAQNKDCKVLINFHLENVKDTNKIFVSTSNTISTNDVMYDRDNIYYYLDLSSDYIFIFSDEKVDKICMIKTTDQCDTPLIVGVNMNTNTSIAIYWAGDKYSYKYYDDKGY